MTGLYSTFFFFLKKTAPRHFRADGIGSRRLKFITQSSDTFALTQSRLLRLAFLTEGTQDFKRRANALNTMFKIASAGPLRGSELAHRCLQLRSLCSR